MKLVIEFLVVPRAQDGQHARKAIGKGGGVQRALLILDIY